MRYKSKNEAERERNTVLSCHDRPSSAAERQKREDVILPKIRYAEKLYDSCFQLFSLTVSRASYAVVLNGLILTAIHNRIENIEYANMSGKYVWLIRILLESLPIMSLIAFIFVFMQSLRYSPRSSAEYLPGHRGMRDARRPKARSTMMTAEAYLDQLLIRIRALSRINHMIRIQLFIGLVILMTTCILVYGSGALVEILEGTVQHASAAP